MSETFASGNTVRPNILIILTDNQSPTLLGTYGNSEVSTPNIDRLASEGIVFEHAFAISGVCSPTRASLMTGLMPSQHGVHNALPTDPARIGIPAWSAVGEFRTLPLTLSQAGYRTALVGKYHLGTHDKPQLGFDHWVTMETGHTKSFVDTDVIDNGKRIQVSGHITDFWTDTAIDFLASHDQSRPFFLFLSYNGPYILPPVVTNSPHSPFAENYRENPPSFPQLPVHEYLRNWAIDSKPSSHMQAESTHAWAAINALNNPRAIINAAAETSHVDAGVGRVLDSLQQLGLDENTLVIYTSDQGSAYGQHGLWGNTSWAYPFPAFDSHLAIPLILRQPGAIAPGQRTTALASQIDLFPTIVEFAGLTEIEIDGATGRSLLPEMSGHGVRPEARVFFEFITMRGVRTAEWKFVKRFPDGPNELYRVSDDPEELVNLIDDIRFADTVAELSRSVDDFFDANASPVFDLWHGGTGKGRLIEDYGKNSIFETRFPDWRDPYIEQPKVFPH
ncbi:MAG: sulfatase-like hydrolase/transferase [Gammaproteobacteria bacterium]|nr:sulfatase-like hydrolase/transferase [Gammaproteobacteria bacterium]